MGQAQFASDPFSLSKLGKGGICMNGKNHFLFPSENKAVPNRNKLIFLKNFLAISFEHNFNIAMQLQNYEEKKVIGEWLVDTADSMKKIIKVKQSFKPPKYKRRN